MKPLYITETPNTFRLQFEYNPKLIEVIKRVPSGPRWDAQDKEDGVNGGEIIKLGLRIPNPERCRSFAEFTYLMNIYEKEFLSKLP